MNNYQAAKHASNKLIVTEARNNPTVVSLIPSFATGINRLEVINTSIDAIGIQQAKNITGFTDNKSFLRNELSDSVLDVSGALYSYANERNNKDLAAKVNFKEAAIGRLTNADLIITAGIVLDEIHKLSMSDLINEGISSSETKLLEDSYASFKTANSEPREAVIDRSGYTQQLADLFAEAADLKKNTLDRLVTQFQRKAPDFYAKYKAASIIIYKRAAKNTQQPDAKA